MKQIVFLVLIIVIFSSLGAQQVERDKVVVEIATGTWCGYCPGAAMGADELVENEHDVAIIEYHNSDPFSNVYSESRIDYYNVAGFPTAFFDGILSVEGGSSSSSMYNTYLNYYENRIDIPSSFELELLSQVDENEANAIVNIKKVFETDSENFTLHIAVTESGIEHYWQGQDHVNFVARTMVPDQFGTDLDFSETDSLEINLNYNLESSWVKDNCELVTFIQDNDTKEILQGTKSELIPRINPISPTTIDFGSVEVGDSLTKPVYVTNYWNTELVGFIFSIDGFEMVNSFQIPPFQSDTLDLTFKPDTAIVYTGNDIVVSMPENEYYLQASIEVTGEGVDTGTENLIIDSDNLSLRNYPNPFNPQTTISFKRYETIDPNKSPLITIYNIKGQKIRTLKPDNKSNSVIWKGKNEAGKSVASGIYFYQFSIGDKKTEINKMLLLK